MSSRLVIDQARRATLWQRTSAGWQILYHQGTLLTSNEDDIAPTIQRGGHAVSTQQS